VPVTSYAAQTLSIFPFGNNSLSANTYANYDFDVIPSSYPALDMSYFENFGNNILYPELNIFNQPKNQIFFNMPSLYNPNYMNNLLSLTKPKQVQFDKIIKTEKTNDTYAPSGKKDLAYWKSLGYDEQKGKELAKDAVARCPFVWNHQCVGYTRETINKVYGTNFTKAGPGYNFGHHILDSKELKGKFKCIKINGIKPEDIPDGAILIWPKTAFGKGKAAQYGHGAISYHGKPYSDNVGCNTMKCNEIWIPVKEQV
jgi:hypothetical protein